MTDYTASRQLTPEQAAVRLDDVVNGPEFSVRIMGVCARQGVATMGELKAALDSGAIASHWKGLGSRSLKEIEEYIAHLLRPTKDLFEDPAYVKYRMEDILGGVTAMMQDVQGRVVRVALAGRVSEDQKRHMSALLRDAADRIATLPVKGE